jgi:hypothetical protein
MEPSEWAQSQAEDMQGKKDAQILKDAVFLKRQKMKEAHAPELWGAIIQAFQVHCAEYNRCRPQSERSIGFSCLQINSYMLRRDAGWSELKVDFNPSTGTIRAKANNCGFNETYQPKVLKDGEVVLFRRGQFPVTPNEIAQTAMEAFLSGREIADIL